MAASRYRVYLRDASYALTDELTDWLSLSLVLRFNGTGTWVLDVAANSVSVPLLTRTAGIVVRRDNVTIFSGSVGSELTKSYRTYSLAGFDDNVLLEEPARPDPSLSEGPYPSAYDVRIGVPSTVMMNYVHFNIATAAPAACKIDGLVIGTDPLLGTTITGRANLQSLQALLSEIAVTPMAGGVGFRILQDDAVAGRLVFTVFEPQDRTATARFGVQAGTAQDYEDTWSFPQANYWVVLGGDGFGTNRTTVEGGDAAAIAEVGRRITGVYDARGITDPGELNQKLAELLAGAVTSRKTTIVPFEVPSLEFGTDWDFGDIVTVIVDGEETAEVVRDVEIGLTNDGGVRITPMIGEAGSGNDERIAAHQKAVLDRLSNLERNWTVPPSSIDRSMLVPLVRPPVGQVVMFAGPTPPAGWLLCDGSVVAQAAYPDLFAVITTFYNIGGEGAGNFRLPDYRGRFPLGVSGSFGLGTTGGIASINTQHDHTGAPHTHPQTHAHAGAVHTHPQTHNHTGAPHTHPQTHSHPPGSHQHNTDVDHNHASFNSSQETLELSALAVTPNTATGFAHRHAIDVPALGFTSNTSGAPNAVNTGNDSTATAASFSGTTGNDSTAGGAAFTGSTGADVTANAATYTGSSGTGGSASVAIRNPYLAVHHIIYAAA